MERFIITTVICAFVFPGVFSLPVEDCGSTAGSFTNVTISSCKDTDPVCILKKNSNVTLDISFTTSVTDNTVTADVHGIIQGIPIPWPVQNPDACKSSGLKCPLEPGKNYHYTATFPIKTSYPTMHLQVKWELQNESKTDIVCALIPVKIK
ncbi:protein NPC2 homolog [Zootermopsis nevadensis]|uniref:NPC2-like protein n=1 Tax=Zootermopsis nevadensis TaxID=136037 RepID=A0A067RFZ4_ZOONE|nr:protein NPC2 homolog [Zootermopsis nevadensis]KDR22662.1 NPC2-like protein [Zootermopsis nevadensis]